MGLSAFGVEHGLIAKADSTKKKISRGAAGAAVAAPAASVGAVGGLQGGVLSAYAHKGARDYFRAADEHELATGKHLRMPNGVWRTVAGHAVAGTAFGAGVAGYGGYKIGSGVVRRIQGRGKHEVSKSLPPRLTQEAMNHFHKIGVERRCRSAWLR